MKFLVSGISRRNRARAISSILIIPLIALLSGCDLRNQMTGPGGFRVTEDGPEFMLCQEMTATRFGATAYVDSGAVETWNATGSVDISPGYVIDREVLMRDFESFVEVPFPELKAGDHVDFVVAGIDKNETSVVAFLVSEEALAGRWITADGAASDSPCAGSGMPKRPDQ